MVLQKEQDLSRNKKMARMQDKKIKKGSFTKKQLFPVTEKQPINDEQFKKRPKCKPKPPITTDSEEDDDKCVCIYCLEPYSASKPGEEWIKCIKCERWALENCISGDTGFFICINCNSDHDDDSC